MAREAPPGLHPSIHPSIHRIASLHIQRRRRSALGAAHPVASYPIASHRIASPHLARCLSLSLHRAATAPPSPGAPSLSSVNGADECRPGLASPSTPEEEPRRPLHRQPSALPPPPRPLPRLCCPHAVPCDALRYVVLQPSGSPEARALLAGYREPLPHRHASPRPLLNTVLISLSTARLQC